MNKPPDETLKQGRNRSWLLVKLDYPCHLLDICVVNIVTFDYCNTFFSCL